MWVVLQVGIVYSSTHAGFDFLMAFFLRAGPAKGPPIIGSLCFSHFVQKQELGARRSNNRRDDTLVLQDKNRVQPQHGRIQGQTYFFEGVWYVALDESGLTDSKAVCSMQEKRAGQVKIILRTITGLCGITLLLFLSY